VKKDDVVKYDGQKLSLVTETIVIMLNKPKNIITTAKDTHNRKTVLDLIPLQNRLFPIGRLDKDTTGLVFLTNNGELANYLMHPKNRIPRIYQAEIEGKLNQKSIMKMKKGIYIGDGEFGRSEFVRQKSVKKRSIVTLKLYEGKKREIRRIFRFLKIKLFSLQRVQYGEIILGNLPTGHWRILSEKETKILKNNFTDRAKID
jgi:pseudouridine synthase